MFSRLYVRFGPHYPLILYGVTRLFAIFAGACCVVYVDWTLDLEEPDRRLFIAAAWVAILSATVMTTLLLLHLSRSLRGFLQNRQTDRSAATLAANRATLEAVRLPIRLALWEACLDPFLTILPICTGLYLGGVPIAVLSQVCVAGFLGLACIIMATFYWMELGMQWVVRGLLADGRVTLRFDELPQSSLGRRLELGFGTTILVTAVMISGLSLQWTTEILQKPTLAEHSIQVMRQQTVTITLIAVAVGLFYARLLSISVTSRISQMLRAMRAVEAGDLQQRLAPTGTDEIDRLARQFNVMIDRLAGSDQSMRDLNANLERTVERRTAELQSSLGQLQELDRLKTQFFSNVSHELRTPLLMILSPISQLRRAQHVAVGLTGDLLEVAEINARRLLAQINQLLEFSAIEAGNVRLQKSRVDVNRLIDLLIVAARPFANERGLQLSWTAAQPPLLIAADTEKVETVFRNLISNAIKFTPAGGQVTLRVHSSSLLSVPGVRVDVIDTGPGIRQEELPRLFQRFSQLDGSTSREFAGTGLGLALAKELIEQHGGNVDVRSEVGQGTMFSVELPVGDLNAVTTTESASESPSGVLFKSPFPDLQQVRKSVEPVVAESAETSHRPHILLVDDNHEVRALIRRLLQHTYRISEAEHGLAGCEVARSVQPDLIISDVMMPHMNGHEFCRTMKADPSTAAIPFMLVTARARTEMKVEGLDAGADDYLCKPFEEDELHARIRSILRLRKMHQQTEQQNLELRSALEERQRLQRQLVQSEKLVSLGQLVAGLAHEVNNAINPVCSGTAVLQKRLEKLRLVQAALPGGGESPEWELLTKSLQLTQVIGQSAQRTAQIVEDMKRFAHPGSGIAIPFDLQRTLETCVNLIRLQHRHVHRFSSEMPAADTQNTIQVHCSFQHSSTGHGVFGQLDQVFLNILGNAVQALGSSGRIEISTRESATMWMVCITDNGPGIDESIRDRIFDPFFTTKPPGQGTGLGLSICHSLITGIGGELTCRTDPAWGTEFMIEIPRNPRTSESK